MNKSKTLLKTIHIDARMIYSSGIGRCLREIVKRLSYENLKIFLYCSYNDYNRFLNECNADREKVIFKKNNSPIYSIREQLTGSIISIKTNNKDIFYFPHYNLPFIVPRNSVFTIHDFIQFKFPEYFNKNMVMLAKLILNNSVKKAKKIIVVSKSTASDFESYFPEYKSKLKVVYNGVSENFKVLDVEEKKKFKRQNHLDKYLLFVGNNKPHKNINALIDAFLMVKRRFSDLKLVLISQGLDLDAFNIKNKEDFIVINNINDDLLVKYYNCASIFVLPSFYEGFGLPVLEAMACGCPVIASNVSSLPELCAGAAILVNPYDSVSIKKAIEDIFSSNNLRNNLIKKGLERSKEFSWDKTSKKYLEVLNNL